MDCDLELVEIGEESEGRGFFAFLTFFAGGKTLRGPLLLILKHKSGDSRFATLTPYSSAVVILIHFPHA